MMSWTGNDRDRRSHFEEPSFSVRGVKGAYVTGKPDSGYRETLGRNLDIWVMDWSAGKGSGSFFSLRQAWSQSVICRALLSSQEPTPPPPPTPHPPPPTSFLCRRNREGFLTPPTKFAWQQRKVVGGCWEERFKKGRATKRSSLR